MKRRRFLGNASTLGSAALFAPTLLKALEFAPPTGSTARVAFVKTTDRAAGVSRAIDLLGLGKFGGKDLFIKPNFNSADATPGSTHEDTLAAVVRKLKAMGAGPLTIGDRSGMGSTREVMTQKHCFTLGKELLFDVVAEHTNIPGFREVRLRHVTPPGQVHRADLLINGSDAVS